MSSQENVSEENVEGAGVAAPPGLDLLRELGQQLRVDSIRLTAVAGSGHPTSSMSAADLMAVLLAKHLCYDFGNPRDRRNDRLVFSKGHASPLLYSLYKAAGALSEEELLTYRKLGSRLEGHPTPALPFVDVATGSLGQGLPVGVGMALAGKRLDHVPFRVWVLCGDSEMSEGSVWEAFQHASFYDLDNLTAIVDVNRLGQTGETMDGWDLDAYAARAAAFGWHHLEIDGHDVGAIDAAYAEAAGTIGRPTVIFARTEKGHGVAEVENKNGFHGKLVPHPDAAIAELGGVRHIRVQVAVPSTLGRGPLPAPRALRLPEYAEGTKVATRAAYADALVALGRARDDVVVLDAEVGNSTYSERFADEFPARFFEMFIAEQQMVAAAVGMQVLGWRPFASSFGAFLSRADDFVRMASVSRANLALCGSHAGVSIGEDGPSQMALGDIAFFRAVFGSTVVYPCDPNQTAALMAQLVDRDGVSYLRATREKTPVIYAPGENFPIGGSRVVRRSTDDVITIVAAGVTLHEAIAAADELAREGMQARVIDLYSIKPIDSATLREAGHDTRALIVVEDHAAEGGIGDAVLEVFADAPTRPIIHKLAVRQLPGSATPAEQLAAARIDAAAIVVTARASVSGH